MAGYRLLETAELVRAVIRDLKTFHAGQPLQDDAVVVCLDRPETGIGERPSGGIDVQPVRRVHAWRTGWSA